MYAATQEATEQSFQDLQSNVNHFYDAPDGRYKRTGQLRDSPRIKEINFSGDIATGEIEIDTNSPHYDPAGRSVQEIYEYAEAGGLLGNPGFWERTEEQIEDNIKTSFGKYFK